MPPITIASSSKDGSYESKLNQLLEDLSEINLSGDIFDESAQIHSHGGFGDVFTGKSRRHDNMAVAVKRLRYHILPDSENNAGAKFMLRELSIWSSVRHTNVLPLLGFVMHGPYPALVSPWIAKGSVRKHMSANPKKPMAHLAKGISSGLLYLHENNIIHSDLKCDNVLLSDFDEPLLADFGISRCATSATISITSTSPKGSARWMAREFFTSGLKESDAIVEHSTETDVWAFGMVLYELLSGLVPFAHLKNDVLIGMALMQGITPSRPTSVCRDEDQELLWSTSQDCWKTIPSDRPSMRSICNKLQSLDDGPPASGSPQSSSEKEAREMLPNIIPIIPVEYSRTNSSLTSICETTDDDMASPNQGEVKTNPALLIHRFTLVKPGATVGPNQPWTPFGSFFSNATAKCDLCEKRLGRKPVLECDDCGLRTHLRCGEAAPMDCSIRAARRAS